MSQAYVIEDRGRTAGIVARDQSGFRFYASERAFYRLEGQFFRTTRDAEKAVRAISKAPAPAAIGGSTLQANAPRRES